MSLLGAAAGADARVAMAEARHEAAEAAAAARALDAVAAVDREPQPAQREAPHPCGHEHADGELRGAVEGWFAAEPERPADIPESDWLSFEQSKHERLLAAAAELT